MGNLFPLRGAWCRAPLLMAEDILFRHDDEAVRAHLESGIERAELDVQAVVAQRGSCLLDERQQMMARQDLAQPLCLSAVPSSRSTR